MNELPMTIGMRINCVNVFGYSDGTILFMDFTKVVVRLDSGAIFSKCRSGVSPVTQLD